MQEPVETILSESAPVEQSKDFDPKDFESCQSPAIAAIAQEAAHVKAAGIGWSNKDWNSNWDGRRT